VSGLFPIEVLAQVAYVIGVSEQSESTSPEPTPRSLRRSANGVLGGVAAGIADRFDLDRNLIRLGFVLCTLLWGFGLALYLALWVWLPRGDDAGREVLSRSTSRRLTLALVAAVVVLGTLAISLRHPIHRLGPGVGLTWLVFLIVLAVIALRTSSRHLSFRRLVAVVFLSAISVMILLIAAFLGFLESTGVPLSGGNGLHAWSPTSLAQVQSSYRTEFGATTVDLSHVRFPATGFAVSASTAVGTVEVIVPANAVVTLSTQVGIGGASYLERNGFRWTSYFRETPTLTSTPSARLPHLILNVQVGIGRVSVERR